MEKQLTPESDRLVKVIEKTLTQYNDGAITSPDCCRFILVTLAKFEKEVCDENDILNNELFKGKSEQMIQFAVDNNIPVTIIETIKNNI